MGKVPLKEERSEALHILLDNADLMPSFVYMTVARDNHCKGLKKINLKPGTIVALDRGYNDFTQFGDWTMEGVYFVTRMKVNTKHHLLERKVRPKNRHILADQIIILTGSKSSGCTTFPGLAVNSPSGNGPTCSQAMKCWQLPSWTDYSITAMW